MTDTAPPPKTAALSASDIVVSGQRDDRDVSIIDPVDISVMPGDAVAIVGESGSGKSLAARAMLQLLPTGIRSTGSVRLNGVELSSLDRKARHRLRGTELAFVMQDPFTMLNPLERCGSQITAALRTARGATLPKRERRREALARLAEVGIRDPRVADQFPFELSGGMRQRVAIAAAIAENPRVLIADEPTTALDVTTQKDVLDLLDRLRITHQLGLVLITHDLRVAAAVCDRIYVMYAGSIVETARATDLVTAPRHPYAYSLLRSDPPIDRRVARLTSIPGSVPAPGHRPAGCRFAPRCPWAVGECETTVPELEAMSEIHSVRCLRANDIVTALRLPDAEPSHPAATTGSQTTHPLIALRDVHRTFGDKVAVEGVDLDVFGGESVGLVGESGSGKTTLARLIVGLCRPSSGQVHVGGVDLSEHRLSKDQWSTVHSTVQMVFQDPYSTLTPSRTIGATLREASRLSSHHDPNRRTLELLAMVGLDPAFARRRPAQLSGGERQRVAIARALARNPKIVVCDEVTSALDVSVQAHILNLLADLRADMGLTYVFITHDLAVVRQVTDRLYVLRHGRVVEHGSTEHVLSEPSHPYTQRLLASVPAPTSPPCARGSAETIAGQPAFTQPRGLTT